MHLPPVLKLEYLLDQEVHSDIMASSHKKFVQSSTSDHTYEQHARAAAVDAYTSEHLLTPSRNKYHDTLNDAYDNAIAQGLPDISCSPTQGKFLNVQVRIAGAKNILEVGTLGGYSAIWLASAGPEVKVTSVEVNPHHRNVAISNIFRAGLSTQITVLLGSGLAVLTQIQQEVQEGKREPFDFVFIDADKENNLNYFKLAVEMVKPRTCIYIDNIVRKGRLVDAEAIKNNDSRVMGARQAVEGIGQDERVEGVVIQTVSEKNYDGFLMAVLK